METPPNTKIHPQRTPTPKISERKRALFGRDPNSTIREESDILSILDGIAPLSPENRSCNTKNVRKSPRLSCSNSDRKNYETYPAEIKSTPRSKRCILAAKTPNNRNRTQENDKQNCDDPLNTNLQRESNAKENIIVTSKTLTSSTDDELRILFNTLKFSGKKKKRDILFDEISFSSSDEEHALVEKQKSLPSFSGNKRTNMEISADEPKQKLQKIQENNYSNACDKFSPEGTSVSSGKILTPSPPLSNSRINSTASPADRFSTRSSSLLPRFKTRKSRLSKFRRDFGLINKGVKHNIKRVHNKSKSGTNVPAEDILKSIRSEKFKFLLSKRIINEKIEKVHEILKNSQNPIEMARPLNIRTDTNITMNFSDSESEDDDRSFSDNEKEFPPHEINTSEVEATVTPKRKFFKSGSHPIRNEYKLINKMKLTVSNGKLSILPSKKKKRRQEKSKIADNSFSTEQQAIADIIQNLDTTENDSVLNKSGNVANDSNANVLNNFEDLSALIIDDDEFVEFRKRIPYNTNDPEVINQQNMYLDLLITCGICTEENFNIFIAEPDKEKATKILDSLVTAVSDGDNNNTNEIDIQQMQTIDTAVIQDEQTLLDFPIMDNVCTREDLNTNITCENKDQQDVHNTHSDEPIPFINIYDFSAETASLGIDSPMEVEEDNNILTIPELFNSSDSLKQIENIEPNIVPHNEEPTKLFSVFYQRKLQPLLQKSTRKRSQNRWNRGFGLNQYQIDAGQKEFGATQCNKCGLVYSVHEPEEEKLHFEYHNSLYILKFKGWIDEDVVMEFPEWNGRIIKISNTSHPKRQERVRDILMLIDRELGFSSHMMPTNFVAYFAVKRHHIVGFCLVKRLDRANRYFCENGVDYCTEETFPARCGISRIWVAPFHRRIRIASKLIKAVQLHTIPCVEISLEEIAFSSPTDDGKAFAKMIAKREDFLVYQ